MAMPHSQAATSPSPLYFLGCCQTARKVSLTTSATTAGSAQRRRTRAASQGWWRVKSVCNAPRSPSAICARSSLSVGAPWLSVTSPCSLERCFWFTDIFREPPGPRPEVGAAGSCSRVGATVAP